MLTLQLLSNWGDFDAIGLSGIEVVLADRSKLQGTPRRPAACVQPALRATCVNPPVRVQALSVGDCF